MIQIRADPGLQLPGGQAAQGLERLGQFASEHDVAIRSEDGHQVGHAIVEAMGRLVEDERSRVLAQRRQPPLTTHRLGWQEAFEAEAIRGQTGRRERGDQSAGSRNRRDPDPLGARRPHQVKARVGDQRRARIGNQGDVLPRQQPGDEAPPRIPFIVIVAGRKRRLDAEMAQQARRMTGVFGGDQGHIAQDLEGAGGDVVQVADGRGNHIKSTRRNHDET